MQLLLLKTVFRKKGARCRVLSTGYLVLGIEKYGREFGKLSLRVMEKHDEANFIICKKTIILIQYKMKTIKLFITGSFIAMLAMTSCCDIFDHCIRGDGPVVQEVRDMEPFSGVASSGSFHVHVQLDDINQVTVEAEENLIPYIYTRVKSGRLIIKTRDHYCIKNHAPIHIYVKATYLNMLDLSGSGEILCDSVSSNYFDIDLSGSGDIDVTLYADFIEADVSGSGEIMMEGEAHETELDISGSGRIRALDLYHDRCFANISGSGKMYVHVFDLLNVNISGSGTVYYLGNPQIIANITGSGKILHY